ncbi:MAG: GntR family transcriptional regulator [Acidobacteria bacterium]|nr:GntR family transcriptional regulator [Acidobacteriota bacterium]
MRALTSSGVLALGARLPPERELAPAFGVNRSSLRLALKALEIMGVLKQRVGDGTHLPGNADAILREPCELLMLIDGVPIDDPLETRIAAAPELAWSIGIIRKNSTAQSRRHSNAADARVAIIAHRSDASSPVGQIEDKTGKIDVAAITGKSGAASHPRRGGKSRK